MCFWWFPPSFHKVMNGCNNIANLNPSAGGLLCTSSLIVSGQSIPQCIEKSCDLKCVQWTCTYFWEFLQVMIWMSVQWEPKSHRLGLTVRRGELVVIRKGKKAPRCGHMMHEGDTLQAETWEFRSLLNIMWWAAFRTRVLVSQRVCVCVCACTCLCTWRRGRDALVSCVVRCCSSQKKIFLDS